MGTESSIFEAAKDKGSVQPQGKPLYQSSCLRMSAGRGDECDFLDPSPIQTIP